jgi:hypothetical protein
MPQLGQTATGITNSQVMVRFALRIVVLSVFATFGAIGFTRSLTALLWMSVMISVVAGVFRRETLLAPTLNYWDEAAAYGSLFCLASIMAAAQSA